MFKSRNNDWGTFRKGFLFYSVFFTLTNINYLLYLKWEMYSGRFVINNFLMYWYFQCLMIPWFFNRANQFSEAGFMVMWWLTAVNEFADFSLELGAKHLTISPENSCAAFACSMLLFLFRKWMKRACQPALRTRFSFHARQKAIPSRVLSLLWFQHAVKRWLSGNVTHH